MEIEYSKNLCRNEKSAAKELNIDDIKSEEKCELPDKDQQNMVANMAEGAATKTADLTAATGGADKDTTDGGGGRGDRPAEFAQKVIDNQDCDKTPKKCMETKSQIDVSSSPGQDDKEDAPELLTPMAEYVYVEQDGEMEVVEEEEEDEECEKSSSMKGCEVDEDDEYNEEQNADYVMDINEHDDEDKDENDTSFIPSELKNMNLFKGFSDVDEDFDEDEYNEDDEDEDEDVLILDSSDEEVSHDFRDVSSPKLDFALSDDDDAKTENKEKGDGEESENHKDMEVSLEDADEKNSEQTTVEIFLEKIEKAIGEENRDVQIKADETNQKNAAKTDKDLNEAQPNELGQFEVRAATEERTICKESAVSSTPNTSAPAPNSNVSGIAATSNVSNRNAGSTARSIILNRANMTSSDLAKEKATIQRLHRFLISMNILPKPSSTSAIGWFGASPRDSIPSVSTMLASSPAAAATSATGLTNNPLSLAPGSLANNGTHGAAGFSGQPLQQSRVQQQFQHQQQQQLKEIRQRVKAENMLNLDVDSAGMDGHHRIAPHAIGQGIHENEVPACQGCKWQEVQILCPGCGNQWYCSRKCQVAAWDEHLEICTGSKFAQK